MQSHVDAICNLLKGGDYDFIRSLLEASFVSKDVLFEAIKQCYGCDSSCRLNVPAIMEFIDTDFDDQEVLNCLFTLFVRSCQPNGAEENVDLFKRMIDMGAKIKKMDESSITCMHPDLFFYYAERNDEDIDLYMQSAVSCRFRGHVQVYDWIADRWMLADIEHDLPWFYKIARATYDKQRYFAQVMAKLSEKIDLHIILLCLWDVISDEKGDLLIYVPDCKYSEELLLFRSLMLIYRCRGEQLNDGTMRLKSFIEENENVKKIEQVIQRMRYDACDRYERMIPYLTQLVDMMKIDN